MSSADYGAVGVQNRTRTLFSQVMWAVSATAGLFALGAYLGRDLGNGLAFVFYILAFVCLIGMRFAIRSSAGLGMALLFGVGLLVGRGSVRVVLIFVHIPGGAVIYSILGLVIFAGLTMVDFQRLRRSTDMDSAPLIAASIFLDALNVFQFFLQLFGGRGRD